MIFLNQAKSLVPFENNRNLCKNYYFNFTFTGLRVLYNSRILFIPLSKIYDSTVSTITKNVGC